MMIVGISKRSLGADDNVITGRLREITLEDIAIG